MIEISTNQLEKIQQYLTQGWPPVGAVQSCGARPADGFGTPACRRWNVIVGENAVVDPDQTESKIGGDVVVSAYSQHPLVNPMLGYGIYLIQLWSIVPMDSRSRDAGAPKVQLVAFTGESAFLANEPRSQKGRYGVAAVVENAVPGVTTDEVATRILVVGDSAFLDNQCIERATTNLNQEIHKSFFRRFDLSVCFFSFSITSAGALPVKFALDSFLLDLVKLGPCLLDLLVDAGALLVESR